MKRIFELIVATIIFSFGTTSVVASGLDSVYLSLPTEIEVNASTSDQTVLSANLNLYADGWVYVQSDGYYSPTFGGQLASMHININKPILELNEIEFTPAES